MLLPLACLFAVGYLLMGSVATSLVRSEFNRRPSAFVPAFKEQTSGRRQDLLHAADQQWRIAQSFWTHIPLNCSLAEPINDFQRKQCSEFWEQLQVHTALSLIPFLVVLIGGLIARDALQGLYLKANRSFQKGSVSLSGVATAPAKLPEDVFSWFFCLRPMSIQSRSGKQFKVYIPYDAPFPKPGQKVVAVSVKGLFGPQRYLGQLYTPHVAVISGVR